MKISSLCTPAISSVHKICVFVAAMIAILGIALSQLPAAEFQLATFSADATPPFGHPLIGGASSVAPVSRVDDPQFAKGFVLLGGEQPIVFVAIDWCEIRNDAYDRWRDILAEAAETDHRRVLVTCVHQHDAPLFDLEAERILRKHNAVSSVCDLKFHEDCIQRTAEALRQSLKQPRRITHIGTSQASVKEVASNRRYVGADGEIYFDRSSMSGGNATKRNADAGIIDPMLKAITFWDGDEMVCALSSYAVHPMSFWGTSWVTSDFPGLARERMQAQNEKVFQIYASGASGNVTAGKYNDGSHDNRPILTQKIFVAMKEAQKNVDRHPLKDVGFRCEPLRFEPRKEEEFSVENLTKQLSDPIPRKQSAAALGLSWRKVADSGGTVDLPAIDLGPAQIILLPGETYVEYQLYAQQLRPDAFVMVIGYGESATGFIPLEKHWEENDGNLDSWCWIAPGAEAVLKKGIRDVLMPKAE
ncbi:MAG: hypothetical protein ACKVT0_04655 [Planctomycetaceae bacterium]